MEKKVSPKTLILLACFCLLPMVLPGCSGKNISNFNNVPDSEGIVVYNLRVLYNGQDITKKAGFFFNGGNTLAVMGKVNEPITIKLPLGDNYISRVIYAGKALKEMDSSGASFLVEPNKINYIGDITINWVYNDPGFEAKDLLMLGGAVGGAVYGSMGDENSMLFQISSEYNTDEMNKALAQIGSNLEIQETPLVGRHIAKPQIVKETEPVKLDTPPPSQQTIRQPANPSDTSELENRLESLKNMYDRGLVTQDEYDAKRKQLIDEL